MKNFFDQSHLPSFRADRLSMALREEKYTFFLLLFTYITVFLAFCSFHLIKRIKNNGKNKKPVSQKQKSHRIPTTYRHIHTELPCIHSIPLQIRKKLKDSETKSFISPISSLNNSRHFTTNRSSSMQKIGQPAIAIKVKHSRR